MYDERWMESEKGTEKGKQRDYERGARGGIAEKERQR